MNLGQTDDAIYYFREALRHNPQYENARLNLERALQTQPATKTDE